jgi:hypothetical protein
LSDITLHFYGLIALFVFLISISGVFLTAFICLIIAFIKSGKANQKTSSHPAFAYFLSTLPLMVINAAAFGILLYFVDSNSEETNQFLDKIAFFAWLPLQPVVWFVIGKIILKVRK